MDYLLKASAVIALFYLCFHFFLKKETFFNHNRWFLLIGIVIALIFPFVVIPIHIVVEPILVPETLFKISENIPVAIPEPKFEWQALVPIIYGIGLTIFLIQFLFQFGSLILLLLKNPKNKDGIYTYVIVNNKISPFSFFKWIVYNPESFNDEELELMLTHEKVHANQLHSIDILIIQLACSIFWFNPLMWFYRKEVRQNLEYIADNKTQEKSNNEIGYQRLLLKTSVANLNVSLSNNFYNSSIKERIVMLKKSRSNRKKQWRYLLMLPLLAGLLMSVNTEKIYVETESTVKNNDNTIGFAATENTIDTKFNVIPKTIKAIKDLKIIFTKEMTDKQLDDIKKELKSNGIEMNLKRLKRNSKGEISDINVDFKTKNGSANYNIKGKNGINPFYFKLDDSGSFGVGAIKDNEEIVIVETISEHKDSKGNVFIHKTNEHHEEIVEDSTHNHGIKIIKRHSGLNRIYSSDSIILENSYNSENPFFIIDRDSVNIIRSYKIDSTNAKTSYFYQSDKPANTIISGDKPMIIINGKVNKNFDTNTIDPNNIEKINVLKGKSATELYGKPGGNGVVVITTKENPRKVIYSVNTSGNDSKLNLEMENCLYILDGKEISKSDLEKMYSKETVSSINVLKGKAAKIKYGEKGINGVVEVTSKNKASQTNSPWRVEVGGVSYIDDDNPKKNSTLAYLTKYTSDQALENHKVNLKKIGVTVKFSKLRRNKAGEITSIKISLINEKGAKSSATWKVNDGIPSIEFGETEGSLIARTSDMN